MGNQFTDYLTTFNSYSKSDIQLQLIFSLIISLFYLLVLRLILRKASVTDFNKQYLSCGLLISLIYNIVAPYLSFSVSNISILNLLINIFSIAIVLIVLLYVESFIFDILCSDKFLKRKVLLWQGITIPLFNFVSNVIVLLLIIVISSFM